MFKLLRKTVILGLAAFGAYRIYELVRPKAEQLASSTSTQVSGTLDSVSTVADKVKQDVASAKEDVVSDIREGIDEQKEQLGSTSSTPRVGTPVDTEAPQVGLG